MNEAVLFSHFAEQLHTNVRIYNNTSVFQTRYGTRKELCDHFTESRQNAELLFPMISEPCLCTVNKLLTYLSVPIVDRLCVIGPVGVCADARVQKDLPALIVPDELINSLHLIGSHALIRMGIFLYNLFAEESIDPYICIEHNCVNSDFHEDSMKSATQKVFIHEEHGETHNPYDAERREMASIENGDLQRLKESWTENFNGNLGVLSDDALRWAKYLCVINTALSARAAIRGGLPYELAYSLSDAYIQQIDHLDRTSIPLMEGIVRNIQVTYTKLVAQRKGNTADQPTDSPLVVRAKEYIFSHLHERLTVNDVAEALNTHPNYLNRVFKRSEGITVHDCILREKINLVCTMLTYSEHSYIEIANYLGFSSQSHLGKVFKDFTGMTLKQYRDTYHKG